MCYFKQLYDKNSSEALILDIEPNLIEWSNTTKYTKNRFNRRN
jgi:hypothetical protein